MTANETDETGVYVQTTEPYQDLFLSDGVRWARADDRTYVYSNEDETVAEVVDEHFVSAAHASAESLADLNTTDDDSQVSS